MKKLLFLLLLLWPLAGSAQTVQLASKPVLEGGNAYVPIVVYDKDNQPKAPEKIFFSVRSTDGTVRQAVKTMSDGASSGICGATCDTAFFYPTTDTQQNMTLLIYPCGMRQLSANGQEEFTVDVTAYLPDTCDINATSGATACQQAVGHLKVTQYNSTAITVGKGSNCSATPTSMTAKYGCVLDASVSPTPCAGTE